MLVDFKAKNFKNFKDGFDFNMRASLIRDLNFSLESKITTKRILTSSVIYGPNASGKTTIIQAMEFFRNLILEGNIHNSQNGIPLSLRKELVPFAHSKEINPVEFEIDFIEEGIEFNYGISFLLGLFDDNDYDRKIINEYLKVNGKDIFIRKDGDIKVFYSNIDEDYVVKGLDKNIIKTYEILFKNNLDNKELFLTNYFKNNISKELFNIFINWISNKFVVLSKFSRTKFEWKSNDLTSIELPKFVCDAVDKIGVMGTKLKYIKNKNGGLELYSFFDNGDKVHGIRSNVIESLGTLRFLDVLPLLVDSILNGTTLVIDEFDNSLHPMVIMSLANIYHDPEINKQHAQLIFNTHNAVLLNNKVFRRDEMCFVEKDSDTKISQLYKMSDFMTNSSTPTRNTTDYIGNYFKNKYGAIEYVDLSPVFEELVNDEKNR